MRRSSSTRRGRPTAPQLAFASDRSGRMELWIRDLRTNKDAQVTRERVAVSGPAWSRDGVAHCLPRRSPRDYGPSAIKPGDCRGGATAGTGAEIGRPTWAPTLPIGRRRRAVSVLGSLPRRAQPAAALRLRVGHLVAVGAFPAAFRRQPRERRPGVVARRHADGVRHRGQAVDGGGRRRGRRDRPARRDRRRSAGVAKLGRRLAPHRLSDAEGAAPRACRRQPAGSDSRSI